MLGRARAQVWPFAPQYRRPRHFHPEHELNLIVAGRARFGIGEMVADVGPGELLSFRPGQDHVLMEGSPNLVLFAVAMTPNLSAEIAGCCRQSRWLPTCSRVNTGEWELLIQKASGLAGSESPGLVAELWERIHNVSGSEATRTSKDVHVLTRRTLDVLATAPELGRDEVARVVRGNPSEVSRFFRRDTGLSLVEYRTRLRLLRFIRLVDEHGSKLTAAAMNSGFGSYSQCHRSFQAELACAPREFFDSGLRERMEHAFEPFGDRVPMTTVSSVT
ncbi:MAG TPA: helix-turn-helix domain-containing protein [Polyangiaceae bacterium]